MKFNLIHLKSYLPRHSNGKSKLFTKNLSGPYIAGGQGGQLPPPGKLFFFSNIVFDFVGLFLLAILFRNLKKTD